MISDGLHPELSEAEYRALGLFSASGFRYLQESPEVWRLHQTDPPEPSRPMRFGTLCHGLGLENGVVLPSNWVEKPTGMSFATKEGKSWRAEVLSRIPNAEFVPAEDFERAAGAAESLRSHPVVAEWLDRGQVEVSMVATDTTIGRQTKGRSDLVSWHPTYKDLVADLKMLGRGVWHHSVEKDIESSGAWLQIAWYASMLECITGRPHTAFVIACGAEKPWPVEVYPMAPVAQARALGLGRGLLLKVAEAERTGIYPKDSRYYDNPIGKELNPGRWAEVE